MKVYNGDIFDSTNAESTSFLQVNSCGIQFPCIGDRLSFRKKGRIDYHIVYIVDGACEVEYEQTRETIKKGGFVLYPPHVAQRYKELNGTKKIWLHFNGFSVAEILHEARLSCGIHHATPAVTIEKTFVQLITEHNRSLTVSNEKGLLLSILFGLGKIVNGVDNTTDKINDCISFIVTHYTSVISIDEMAASCNLSKSRFMCLFKEKAGMPPHSYQKMLRIENSKHLLTATKLDVADISRMSGYQDPLYFSRLFKKQTGLSPLQYRSRALTKESVNNR